MTMTIPSFHASDKTRVKGEGSVFIASRTDAVSSGVFTVRVDVHFDPAADPYPVGSLNVRTDLSDGMQADFVATSIELINSYGKHNPTAYMTGRCSSNSAPKDGLRYWVMFADNKGNASGTPDVAAFAIHDRKGDRIAYGAGPLRTGNIAVAPK